MELLSKKQIKFLPSHYPPTRGSKQYHRPIIKTTASSLVSKIYNNTSPKRLPIYLHRGAPVHERFGVFGEKLSTFIFNSNKSFFFFFCESGVTNFTRPQQQQHT